MTQPNSILCNKCGKHYFYMEDVNELCPNCAKSKLILALDNFDLLDIYELTSKYYDCIKINSFVYSKNKHIFNLIKNINNLFLDLKLHDTPQTIMNTLDILANEFKPKLVTIWYDNTKYLNNILTHARNLDINLALVVNLTSSELKYTTSDFVNIANKWCDIGGKYIITPYVFVKDLKIINKKIKTITPGVTLTNDIPSYQNTVCFYEDMIGVTDYIVLGRTLVDYYERFGIHELNRRLELITNK